MTNIELNETNFFNETFCIFEPTRAPRRKPDYESESGSRYWFENDGVIRSSDHWGHEIGGCRWFLANRADRAYMTMTFRKRVTGFSKFSKFEDLWNFVDDVPGFLPDKPNWYRYCKIDDTSKNYGKFCYPDIGAKVSYNV